MTSTSGHHNALRGVVAVGASADGVEALTKFASRLQVDLPYAILVALHMPANAPSVLARIIDRSGPLPATSAAHGAELEPGLIYVGVPNHHLLVDDHRVALSDGPTEKGYRPAIDALAAGVVDHKAAAAEIGSLLAQLADRETEERDMEPDNTWNWRTGSRWAAVSRQRSTVRRWHRARDTPARTATAP